MNKVTVTVKSGISVDGFVVTVDEPNGSQLFREDYAYGYNASYKKDWATKDKPYVTDLLQQICKENGADFNDIEVIAGKNVFANEPMTAEDVQKFIDKYLQQPEPVNTKEDKAQLVTDVINALADCDPERYGYLKERFTYIETDGNEQIALLKVTGDIYMSVNVTGDSPLSVVYELANMLLNR